MQAIGYLIFLALGVFQMIATYAGLNTWLGLHWIVAGIGTLLLGWFPFIGTIIGIFGAVNAWRWPVWQALLLFGAPLILALCLAGLASMRESTRR